MGKQVKKMDLSISNTPDHGKSYSTVKIPLLEKYSLKIDRYQDIALEKKLDQILGFRKIPL